MLSCSLRLCGSETSLYEIFCHRYIGPTLSTLSVTFILPYPNYLCKKCIFLSKYFSISHNYCFLYLSSGSSAFAFANAVLCKKCLIFKGQRIDKRRRHPHTPVKRYMFDQLIMVTLIDAFLFAPSTEPAFLQP